MRHFLEKFSQERGSGLQRFEQEAMRCLMNFGWPGNVRQLENVVERAVVLSGGRDVLGLEDLPELLADPRALRDAYLAEINSFQDEMRKGCLAQKIDYVRILNNQPLDVLLSSYLAARAARTKRRK